VARTRAGEWVKVGSVSYLKRPGVVCGRRNESRTGTLAIGGTQNPQWRRTLWCIRNVDVGTLVAVVGGSGGGSRVRAAGAGNERYQSMLISSQQIASVAAIKHRKDARFQATNAHETRARETKDKCDGMLHTRLRCKQRKKRVVDDEIGLSGQEQGKRREAAGRG
jgi:hypothetical protein